MSEFEEPKQFFTVYETICLLNGKTYIGAHQTLDPDDSYIGSGTMLIRAIKKYGRKNFKKNVLFYANDIDSMFWAEAILCDKEYAKNASTYNIICGGNGPTIRDDLYKKNMSSTKRDQYQKNPDLRDRLSISALRYWNAHPEAKSKMANKIRAYYNAHPEAGHKHSKRMKESASERKEMMSAAHKRWRNNLPLNYIINEYSSRSAYSISKEFGVCKETILSILRDNGVNIRPPFGRRPTLDKGNDYE